MLSLRDEQDSVSIWCCAALGAASGGRRNVVSRRRSAVGADSSDSEYCFRFWRHVFDWSARIYLSAISRLHRSLACIRSRRCYWHVSFSGVPFSVFPSLGKQPGLYTGHHPKNAHRMEHKPPYGGRCSWASWGSRRDYDLDDCAARQNQLIAPGIFQHYGRAAVSGRKRLHLGPRPSGCLVANSGVYS